MRQEAADEQQRLYEEFEKKRKELDESLAENRKEYNMLNACNKLRSKRNSELDDEITKKTAQATQLDDEITAKNNKITELNTQISKAIEEKYEIKSRGDWQEPMFTGMGKYLYGARMYDPILLTWNGIDPLCAIDQGTLIKRQHKTTITEKEQ